MDCHNQPDFTDQNTIVYGHKMKNGSMFGTLEQTQDKELFEQHPEFYLHFAGQVSSRLYLFPLMWVELEVRDIGIISRKREDFTFAYASSYRDYDTGTELSVTISYAVYLCHFMELPLSGTWKISAVILLLRNKRIMLV